MDGRVTSFCGTLSTVPRSADEKARLARKYGRRLRVLKAERNRRETERIAHGLLDDLRKLGVAAARIAELRRGLDATDDTRHGRAVWAILDALEAAEDGR